MYLLNAETDARDIMKSKILLVCAVVAGRTNNTSDTASRGYRQ